MAQAAPKRVLGEMLTPRQKFLLLNSLMLAMFISALDSSIVTTATPRILADLGGFKLLSWILTVYVLASTVVVPLVGKLSDMFGRKPFIMAGILIFVIGSAASGAAPNMPFLIFARAFQGVGGGMLFGSVFATLGDLFTPIERAKYMGYFIGAFTLANLAGPTVGGFLTDGPGWRWCFYINLPVGAAAAFFISMNLPNVRGGGTLKDIDFLGSFLLSGATLAVLLGLVWSNEAYGWATPQTIGLFASGALLIVAFVFQEARHPHAIFPLEIFRNRVFVQANLLVVLQGAGMFGAIQYLPTFIQTALGASATASGLVSTPQALGLLAASIVGGQLVSRTGKFKYQVIVGAVLLVISSFLLQLLDVNEAEWHIAVFMVVAGLGGGLVGPTISVITQSAVGQELVGVATSSRQFFMQMGQVMGIAIFGLVFTTTYTAQFSSNLTPDVVAGLPHDVYNDFQDPTLGLDPKRYDAARAEVLALPNGQATLDAAIQSQKDAVTTAIDRLFLGATGIAIIVLLLAITMKEIPLRRTFARSDDLEGEDVPLNLEIVHG